MTSSTPLRRALFLPLVATLLAGSDAVAQLSDASIDKAYRYSMSHHGVALIIREKGQVRFEEFYNGYRGEPLHIYSGTKSFFGVLAVMAEQDRLLKLDEKVSKTIPEWADDPRKSKITIRDLLTFTAGLESGFEEIYSRSQSDKLELAVKLDAVRDRGASFIYGPGSINVFAEVLKRKLQKRRITYEEYLRKRITSPLGIDITQWQKDSFGNPVPSAGMYMTGKDWMKFGDFINNGGEIRGGSLVKSTQLAKCFQGTPINPAFGLGFWLNSYAPNASARPTDIEEDLELNPMPENWSRACLCKEAPSDLVVSLGSTFQRLYMVPSMDLVVVHHGTPGRTFRDYEFLRFLFENAQIPKAAPPEKKSKPLFKNLFKGPQNRQ